jgi:hypothetical protein
MVGTPQVILRRHLLAGESEYSWEISASSVKHRIADRPSPEKFYKRESGFLASSRLKFIIFFCLASLTGMLTRRHRWYSEFK